ncbi:MAG: 5-methylthioadenosine/S-adenosylhomocysteine nucleosidase [Proteobacteria bacterium]|nr:5-methylthioadenosine/S-adenosylhomocysteine nucleosidase [Pseudomonadota bacterium]
MSGSSTLFAMAAEQEYGPALRSRIRPVMIGVGPVEAAVNLTAELGARAHRGDLPKLVVSLGSAGSRKLRHCEVYQVTSVAYRDIDASPLGFAKGTTPLLDIPAVVPLPLRLSGVPEASLSTGGNIVSGAAYDLVDADMVDMETFALWRAAQKFGVPLLGLRGISDGKAEITQFADWTEYLHIIDEKLATIVDRILAGEVVAAG